MVSKARLERTSIQLRYSTLERWSDTCSNQIQLEVCILIKKLYLWNMETKHCPRCEEDKPIESFYDAPDRANGMTFCKKCFNRYCMDRWIQRKLAAITYKGSKCVKCNLHINNSHYAVFEFHHLDPTQKDYSWTKLRLRSIESIKEELDKCALLCANCHRIVHVEQRALS